MINRWNDTSAQDYAKRHQHGIDQHGIDHPLLDSEALSLAYATTLLGADNDLTMHGGGNTSIKTTIVDDSGNGKKRALFVKATGTPLSAFLPEHFVAMDLEFLEGLRSSAITLDDRAMARAFREHQLIRSDLLPSIETLMHAFVQEKVVAHTHPAAILKIVNRVGGGELLKECFGGDLAFVPYARMGYDLAAAVSGAVPKDSNCLGVVMAHHGLIVWEKSARAAYDLTIALVNKAEGFLSSMAQLPIAPGVDVATEGASIKNYEVIAPIVSGCLSRTLLRVAGGGGGGVDADGAGISTDNFSLTLLNTPDVMELIASVDGKRVICDPPMTPDYPMYFRIVPVWVDFGMDRDQQEISSSIRTAINKYVDDYGDNPERHGITGVPATDLIPRAVIHPQVGVICVGRSEAEALKVADFTRQALSIRRAIAESGGAYESLGDEYIFDMQYRGYQKI